MRPTIMWEERVSSYCTPRTLNNYLEMGVGNDECRKKVYYNAI